MFVSCICLTMSNRREWLPKAIDCFLSQDYAGGTELIIVDDSPAGIIPAQSDIRMFECADVIGAKRNFGAQQAKGELIVHFDDDDFSAPGRVSDQVKRLLESGRAVTSYRNMHFTDGRKTWVNRNWPGGYGTSLAYRRAWWENHPFPELQIGEDWEFVAAAMRANEFIAGEAQEFLVASIHWGNTSPRQIGPGWELLS